jgi:hypothetical protein
VPVPVLRTTTEIGGKPLKDAAGVGGAVMLMAAGPAVVADAPRGPLFADPGHLAETGPAAVADQITPLSFAAARPERVRAPPLEQGRRYTSEH